VAVASAHRSGAGQHRREGRGYHRRCQVVPL